MTNDDSSKNEQVDATKSQPSKAKIAQYEASNGVEGSEFQESQNFMALEISCCGK